HNAIGLRKEGGSIDADTVSKRREPVEDAERGIFRCRGHLGERRQPACVDRDEIGKGAADINADAVHASASAAADKAVGDVVVVGSRVTLCGITPAPATARLE